jgi:subtilisin family serine protease
VNGSDSVNWAVRLWKSVFDRGSDPQIKNTDIIRDLEAYHNTLLNNRKRKEDLPVDFRGALTKDNYENIHDSIYGNNNLKSSSGNHGTHVSGIIGAIRNNNIGMDGIVDNVRIMMIRAVPGGDEHDKDVALAIRYAVNNGASIINMSFGKPVSPYKQLVDDAIAYAASKNVLLVHGSGNDGQDIDENSFYPSPFMQDGTKASNMLTVGASGDYSLDGLVAGFSNYGIKTVDLFAPGMYINSTITNNNYEPADGTSMASPVAAGVAGLIKSYFPALTPAQIIDLLMRSGTSITESVTLPGTDKKTSLNKLCKSGKIINAYEAVKLALQQYAH